MQDKQTEIQLTAALANDSMKAFDALFVKYSNAVFANIYKIVQQKDNAEDVLQDVFLSLWENRHKIKEDQSVPGWLFVVSYNKSLSYLKRTIREKKLLAKVETDATYTHDTDREVIFELQLDLVTEAIDKLPVKKKEVFTLCKLEGKTYQEAALILGISTDTVKDYMKIATKFIREQVLHKYSKACPAAILLITFLRA